MTCACFTSDIHLNFKEEYFYKFLFIYLLNSTMEDENDNM